MTVNPEGAVDEEEKLSMALVLGYWGIRTLRGLDLFILPINLKDFIHAIHKSLHDQGVKMFA
jgi:hypothetical protein